MSARPLEREFQYFLDHQKELVTKHRDKVLVIKDEQVIGVYDSALQAVKETVREHEPGTFLVQECKPGAAAYTAVFCGLHIAAAS